MTGQIQFGRRELYNMILKLETMQSVYNLMTHIPPSFRFTPCRIALLTRLEILFALSSSRILYDLPTQLFALSHQPWLFLSSPANKPSISEKALGGLGAGSASLSTNGCSIFDVWICSAGTISTTFSILTDGVGGVGVSLAGKLAISSA